jgi:hypothetical protein
LYISPHSIQNLSEYISKGTSIAHKENQRLKIEIGMQKAFHQKIQAELEVVKGKHKSLKRAQSEFVDERRRVLNLKACMTCTPDMDIVIGKPRLAPVSK